MPIPGEIVRGAERANCVRALEQLTKDAQSAIARFTDTELETISNRPFSLLEVPQAVIQQHGAWMRSNIIWEDDHNCLYRAVEGALKLNHDLGTTDPVRDSFAAGIAVIYPHNPWGGWPFHCATAVRIEGRSDIHVLDYLGADDPGAQPIIELKRWASEYSARPENTKVFRPYNGSGATLDKGAVLPGYLNVSGFEHMRRNLRETWMHAEDFDVHIVD